MFNPQFYKIFNPELKNLNKNKLIFHYKNNINNDTIQFKTLKDFFAKYPNFDHTFYKNFNNIQINDKFELMAHWHFCGVNENKLCCNDDFNKLYPEFNNNSDINLKIEYHKKNFSKKLSNQLNEDNEEVDNEEVYNEKINNDEIDNEEVNNEEVDNEEVDNEEVDNEEVNNEEVNNEEDNTLDILKKDEKEVLKIENGLNPKIKIIGVLNCTNHNFILKSLSLLNSENNYNIVSDEKLNISNFLLLNKELILEISDFLIIEHLNDIDVKKYNKIFYLKKNNQNYDNCVIYDDYFDNEYLNNKIIKSTNKQYILQNNTLFLFNKNNIHDKIYIPFYFLKKYEYNSDIFNDKIEFLEEKNNLEYGLIFNNFDKNFYIKFYNEYFLTNKEYIIDNNILNIEKIKYDVEEKNIINKKFGKFEFNIILIVDKNSIYFEDNLNFLKNQNYTNFNILIFFNQVSSNLKSDNNIYVYKSDELLNTFEIINFFTRLSNNNSLITIINNEYLIDYYFSLEKINLYFIINQLLFTNIYTNKYLNLLIFKKELFANIENKIDFSNYKNYLELIYNYFNIITKNNYCVKINLGKENKKYEKYKDFLNIYYEKNEIDILSNYLSIKFKKFENEKKILLFDCKNPILKNFINKDLILFKSKILNNNDNYLDLLIYLYNINKINYKFLLNNLIYKINKKDSSIQIILFITDLNANFLKEIDFNNFDLSFNFIHFGKKYDNFFEKFNYVFLKNTILNDKNQCNQNLAFNLIFYFFENQLINYSYLYFINNFDQNFFTNINKINNLDIEFKLIDNNLFIKKDLFELVGYFDPELFFDNINFSTLFLIEKIKKVKNINISSIDNINISENLLNNFYKNLNNLIKLDKNKDILLNYLSNRNLIDYSIFEKIKTVIINLEKRVDRLQNIKLQCENINLNNFEIFKGIVINDDNLFKYKKLLNFKKIWKEDNNEYYNSALGCKVSHLEILKKNQNINQEFLMILEDDIIFEQNFIIYLNLCLNQIKNKDWDILFITTNLKNKEDAIKINSNLLKINNGLTTTGQIFNKNKIEKIIKMIEKSDVEIDNTYNKLNLKYCIYPMCGYQAESYSDINKKVLNYGKFHKKFIY